MSNECIMEAKYILSDIFDKFLPFSLKYKFSEYFLLDNLLLKVVGIHVGR